MIEVASTASPLTADAFVAWAMQLPKGQRFELVDGEVVPMAPERAGHALTKALLWRALTDALEAAGLTGTAYPDGMSVRVDAATVYEPDAVLRLGPPLDLEAMDVPDPVVVGEVVSRSSRSLDTTIKLDGYFRLPTVRHYLILTLASRTVVHHRRDDGGRIQTAVLRHGALRLDPPGLTLDVATLFP
jgi:Uma2 family endonuclease